MRGRRDTGARPARDLCETVDVIAWASASKAVVCRRQTRVGSATLREAPFAPEDPDATTPAMLEGVRAMGAEDALELTQDALARETKARRLAESYAAQMRGERDVALERADEAAAQVQDTEIVVAQLRLNGQAQLQRYRHTLRHIATMDI